MIKPDGEPILDVIEDTLGGVEHWAKRETGWGRRRIRRIAGFTVDVARGRRDLLRNAVKEINGQPSLVGAVEAEQATEVGSIALID